MSGLQSVAFSTALLPDEVHELGAGSSIGAKKTQYVASHHVAALFLNAARHHAEVLRLDHDGDAFRLQNSLYCVCDLNRQSLLNLHSACEHVRNSSELRQPYDLPIRNEAMLACPKNGNI